MSSTTDTVPDEGSEPTDVPVSLHELSEDSKSRFRTGNYRLIIDALLFYGGDASTARILDYPKGNDKIPKGSIYHNLSVLSNDGIIEKARDDDGKIITERTRSGHQSEVHMLTDLGWTFIEKKWDTDTKATYDQIVEIEKRSDRALRISSDVAERMDVVEGRYESIDDLKRSHNELADRIEALEAQLKEQRT